MAHRAHRETYTGVAPVLALAHAHDVVHDVAVDVGVANIANPYSLFRSIVL